MKSAVSYALVGIMLIGLAVGAAVFYERSSTFGINRNIELAIDYMAVVRAARGDHVQVEPVLEELRKAGATTMTVRERTLFDYYEEGRVGFYYGHELLDMLRTAGNTQPPPRIVEAAQNLFVVVHDRELAQKIHQQLQLRFASPGLELLELGEVHLIDTGRKNEAQQAAVGSGGASEASQLVPQSEELETALPRGILGVGLGFERDDVTRVLAAGYRLTLVVLEAQQTSTAVVEGLFERLPQNLPEGTRVLFRGEEVPGYPKAVDELADILREHDMGLALIERENPDGIAQLTEKLAYDAVKMHTLWPGEPLQDVVIAVRDRNVRMLYNGRFNSLVKPGSVWTMNAEYVGGIERELNQAGFSLAGTSGFTPFCPSGFQLAVLAAAVAAGYLLFVEQLYPVAPVWHVLALTAAVLGTLVIVSTPYRDLYLTAAALAGALIFPVLGFPLFLAPTMQEEEEEPGLGVVRKALFILLFVTATTTAGAVIVSGLLADTPHTLQLSSFRGVKLALAFPPALTAVYYSLFVLLPGEQSLIERFQKLLFTRINVLAVFIAGLAAVLLGVVLLRSGNFPVIPVAEIEVMLRRGLEELLGVRPRSKELLIGHPALVLAAALMVCGHTRFASLFAVVAALGQSSVLNTFTHLHTPLSINLVRTAQGLWLGGLIGLVLAGAALAAMAWKRNAAGQQFKKEDKPR